MNRNDFEKFAEKLIDTMDIPEEQKVIMQGVFDNTLGQLSDNNINELEGQVIEFVEEEKKKQSVFD